MFIIMFAISSLFLYDVTVSIAPPKTSYSPTDSSINGISDALSTARKYLLMNKPKEALKITELISTELGSKFTTVPKPILVDFYLTTGSVYLALGKQATAILELKKGEQLDPNNLHILTKLGYAYEAAFDQLNAKKYFEKSININPSNHAIYIRLSVISIKEKKFQDSYYFLNKAINQLNLLIKQHPDSTQLIYELGIGYIMMGEWTEAEKKINMLQRQDPLLAKQLEEISNRSQLQMRKDIRDVETNMSRKPNDLNIQKTLATMYFYIKEYDKALKLLKRIILKEPNSPEIHSRIAIIYFQKNDYLRATEHLIVAAKYVESPSSLAITVFSNLGRANIFLNNFKDALLFFRKAVDIASQLTDPPVLEVAYARYGIGIAMLRIEQNIELNFVAQPSSYNYYYFQNLNKNIFLQTPYEIRINKIISEFKKVIEDKPDLVEAHYALGVTYKSNQQLSLAISSFQEAIRYKPNYPEALIGLAFTYVSLNQTELAIKNLKKASVLLDTNIEIKMTLAQLYTKTSQFELATETYEDILKQNSKYKTALFSVGELYATTGNWKKARQTLLQLKSIDIELSNRLSNHIQKKRSGL
ncbi:hypothetical protein CHS0354_024149 [Potamilus streckersoni]|uniref:Tetratricopeptide repeat protein n=1 Tax=Potamilus streckersoni TaxID=2493646 RepID=A0AAE0S0A4_9BIVA|nr:hypothetical protein CHS0354_024149 [Potamilus streckersoni]